MTTQVLSEKAPQAVAHEPPVAATDTTIQVVRKTIRKHFPKLWPAVDAGLSTCATLSLKDNANPVAVIYEGPPSSSKSSVADMFAGAKVDGDLLGYRSDNFTAVSI